MANYNGELPDSLNLKFQGLLSSSPTILHAPASPQSHSKQNVTLDVSHPPIISLDVAGKLFKVSADVLTAESGLFQRQLSGRFDWTPQRDGTYFLDADPALFEHLLRFMRRPSVFPLFWSKASGFDYDLYQRLQAEAEYFQMDALHEWIKAKKYLEAVVVHVGEPHILELQDIGSYTMSGSTSEDWHYVSRARKTYICPRGIRVHYGSRDACGGACRKAQGDSDTKYDEEDYLR